MVEKPQRTDPFSIFWRLLRVGFETTTQHFWLLTIPLMLDILLWVGPRLRITHLAEPGLDWWMSQLDAVPQETTLPMTPDEISAVMVEAIERTNLLTQLTLPIVGVPVLMENLSPLKTPIVTANVSIDSPGALIANFVILTLLGLVLSTAYFSMIAQVVRTGEINWRDFGRNLLPYSLKLLGLLICIFFVYLLIAIPLITVASFVGLINLTLSTLVILGGSVVFLWAFVFLSFSVQSMFIKQQAFYKACFDSMRFVQQHLRFALPLLLGILLIARFADSLWLRADDGSWLTLVSLIGHAFIATALLIALFTFYHDQTHPQQIDGSES